MDDLDRGALDSYGPGQIVDTVSLNAVFPTLMTAALVPALLPPALVVNVGSLADHGLPLVSFYGASKTFNHGLSLSLQREMWLDGRDVEVVVHRIGKATETAHTQVQPSFFCPSARVVARSILARTGCGLKSVVPYWPHALQHVMLQLVPETLGDRFMMNVMRDLRAGQDAKKTE